MLTRRVLLATVPAILLAAAQASALQEEAAFWFRGAQLMEAPRAVRLGYAAGAHDMLSLLADIAAASPEDTAALVTEAARCMRQKTAGSLGKFADWAESVWRNRHSSAARLLLAQACR